MGAAESTLRTDGSDPECYVPPQPNTTERVCYSPPVHHVGMRIFGCDKQLTDAAVLGPVSERRLILDYLYLEAIDGATLKSVFAVDTCRLGTFSFAASARPSSRTPACVCSPPGSGDASRIAL